MRRDSTFGMVSLLVMAMSVVSLVFIGCATQTNMLPTAEQLTAGGVMAPTADKTALQRGRALAMTECASCHRFYWPHEYSPDRWRGITRKMGERASLSESQTTDLLAYLTAASRAAASTP